MGKTTGIACVFFLDDYYIFGGFLELGAIRVPLNHLFADGFSILKHPNFGEI